jgi:hypothetical protein
MAASKKKPVRRGGGSPKTPKRVGNAANAAVTPVKGSGPKLKKAISKLQAAVKGKPAKGKPGKGGGKGGD